MKNKKTKYPKLSKELVSKWSLSVPLYIKEDDKRYKKYVKQLKKNGFCDCETWGLSSVIAEFILPRLKRFKEVNNGFPGDLTEEKWNEIIDKMIFAFDWVLTIDDKELSANPSDDKAMKEGWEKYNDGMKLFAEYFMHLWW